MFHLPHSGDRNTTRGLYQPYAIAFVILLVVIIVIIIVITVIIVSHIILKGKIIAVVACIVFLGDILFL
jgi:hypothetical protein